MKGHLILLLLSAAPALLAETVPAAAPGAPLRPFTTSYAVAVRGLNAGTTDFKFRQESSGEWTYLSRSQPRGLFRLLSSAAMTVTSRMSIGAEGVRPLQFSAHENDDASLTGDVHFDWTANRATGIIDGVRVDMALQAGVQDDLSVQIALIQALANGQTPAGFSVFDKKGIREYAYTRVGAETLHTPVGDVATIIYRSQRAHSPRSTRFWCAPEYGFVPMRAEQRREDHLEWTMTLRSIHRD